MKKILFYFNSMQPAGGIERVISTLANHFCEFMEVTVLVKDEPFSHYSLDHKIKLVSLESILEYDMNHKLKRIGQAGINFVQSSIKLKKYLKNRRFDLFYLAHPLNVLEFHIAHGINKQVIITEHGDINAYNDVYKNVKKWLYPKSRSYVVPTITDANTYEKLDYPVHYIPHFKSKLNYKRSKLESKIALSVGRMTEIKRQWILIELWNNLVHKHNILDWKLHLVGEGNLRDEYISKINECQLQDYIKILPPIARVEEYYKEATIFLLCSESEGFGMVLLEAISFGLPCVTYDSPAGPRDIIENDVNGYLVSIDDFKQFEKSTIDLISCKSTILRLSDGAYKSSFKWNDEVILETWKKILY